MEKLTYTNLEEKQRIKLNNWYEVDEAIQSFANNAKPVTFEFLFEKDGEKLWNHYVLDCGRDFTKFRTYLKREQMELLVTNAMYNDMLYL